MGIERIQPHERLEERLASWVGEPWDDPTRWVACSSGTAALHLAIESLGLPPESTVLVPDFTMVAVPRSVVLAGLRPFFVDCGPDLNLDADLLPHVDVSRHNVRAVVANFRVGTGAGAGGVCRNNRSTFVGCKGGGCKVCAEKIAGYNNYLANHPGCIVNAKCRGKGYVKCSVTCPAPTEADR